MAKRKSKRRKGIAVKVEYRTEVDSGQYPVKAVIVSPPISKTKPAKAKIVSKWSGPDSDNR